MPDNYMVYRTKNRETGTEVQLFDTKHADNKFDTAMRWAVLCQSHNVVEYHEKQADAYKAMTSPSEWCMDCEALKKAGTKFGQDEKTTATTQTTTTSVDDDEGPSEEDIFQEESHEAEKAEEDESEEEEVSIDPKN